MIRAGLVGLAMLLLGAAPASREEAFRTEMLERLRVANPKESFAINTEPLVILRNGGGPGEARLNLHNIFAFCSIAEAAACEATKDEWSRKATIAPPAVTRSALRLLVRSQGYVDYALAQGGEGSGSQPLLFSRKIGDDLRLIIAADGPDTIMMVGAKQLAELKMTEAEAWAAANANMRASLPALPSANKLRKSAVGFEAVPYASAILGDVVHWSKVSAALRGELFATVISDDFIFIGTMPDSSVASFAGTVDKDCASASRCISPHVYRFRAGQWRIAG